MRVPKNQNQQPVLHNEMPGKLNLVVMLKKKLKQNQREGEEDILLLPV